MSFYILQKGLNKSSIIFKDLLKYISGLYIKSANVSSSLDVCKTAMLILLIVWN